MLQPKCNEPPDIRWCSRLVTYFVYNLLWSLLLALGLPLAAVLSPFFKRYRSGFFQRLGFLPHRLRSEIHGPGLVWLHGASVGEILSLEAFVRGLRERFPQREYIVSTSTSSGLRAARNLEGIAGAFLMPLDHPFAVSRVVRQLKPALLILNETEIWPNLIRRANRFGARVLLVSGRLSLRSYRRYRFGLGKRFLGRIFSHMSCFCMQSTEDARRITALGAPADRVFVAGDLKFARALEPTAGREQIRREELGIPMERAVLVGGSTHAGEENVILQAFRRLKGEEKNLLLILAPRHPERFREVETLLRGTGFRYQRRSRMDGREVRPDDDVILLDTLGELPSFYPLATVAFVGGSLSDVGGHNLLEPAMWRKPVFFGPFTGHMKETAERMKSSGGGKEVATDDELFTEVLKLLKDRDLAREMGDRAHSVLQEKERVLDQHLDAVEKCFGAATAGRLDAS